jgi:anti-sigma-K factor RskA
VIDADRPTEPAPKPRGVFRRFTTRSAEKRAALVQQSWPVFFRSLAIETAVVAVLVGAVVLIIWLTRG